ncbi:MAG: 23S rRNA (guanosine2251-2'-O)-methyltransferase [Candidatus Paceibacteria bacterium]|jgi:23S rRNA (guanosine2251-2'-O)-methyltransferase
MKYKVLILNDIRSVYNVGAIFRTADSIGIDKIYLTGYTPSPLDRFGRKRQDLHKSALGAEESVSWEYKEDVNEVLETLGEDGFKVVALEQFEDSVDYKELDVPEKTAILFGNEVYGVPEELLSKVDIVTEIPMNGKKESLNVSVAAGILLYRLFDR